MLESAFFRTCARTLFGVYLSYVMQLLLNVTG